MKTIYLLALVSSLLFACGGGGGSDTAVQKGVDDVAQALVDKADECGFDVPANARFECDGSVSDAKGLEACAKSIAPLSCDYLSGLAANAPESPECAPFQKVCSVR